MMHSGGSGEDGGSCYVGESLSNLSPRAQEFIQTESHRIDYDRQLTGDALRAEIQAVHGREDDRIVQLLDAVQDRYGGLAYDSGYFGNDVVYTPVCEPEEGEELDILYAVQSGTSAGASLDRNGSVFIGWDERSAQGFVSLDRIIEWDALFHTAARMPYFQTFHRDGLPGAARMIDMLGENSISASEMAQSSGSYTFWLLGPGLALSVNSVWAELDLPMPPVVHLGTTTAQLTSVVRDVLEL